MESQEAFDWGNITVSVGGKRIGKMKSQSMDQFSTGIFGRDYIEPKYWNYRGKSEGYYTFKKGNKYLKFQLPEEELGEMDKVPFGTEMSLTIDGNEIEFKFPPS